MIFSVISVAVLCSGCTFHEHNLERVNSVSATCETEGNISYWKCTECGKMFSDENAETQIVDNSSVIIPAKGHETVYIEEVEPTCTGYGTVGFWKCSVCGEKFNDAQATDKIHDENLLKVEPKGHALQVVNAQAATCTRDGNIEYWKCKNCNEVFYDRNGENSCTLSDVKISAGHVYDDEWKYNDKYHWKECVACGEVAYESKHSHNVQNECAECGYEWTYTPGLTFETLDGGTAYSVGLSGYDNEITDIVIPSTFNGLPVTKIRAGGFRGSNITSVKIPSSINYIGSDAFFISTKLAAVYIDDVAAWSKIIFESGTANPLAYGTLFVNGEKATLLEIPDEVISISGRAFSGSDEIKAIVIGKKLSSVGSYAFSGCDNLSDVYYKGTASEWSSIMINGYGNDALIRANVYYYSENDPFADGTVISENYWHYDEKGIPIVWVKE